MPSVVSGLRGSPGVALAVPRSRFRATSTGCRRRLGRQASESPMTLAGGRVPWRTLSTAIAHSSISKSRLAGQLMPAGAESLNNVPISSQWVRRRARSQFGGIGAAERDSAFRDPGRVRKSPALRWGRGQAPRAPVSPGAEVDVRRKCRSRRERPVDQHRRGLRTACSVSPVCEAINVVDREQRAAVATSFARSL